MTGTKERKKSRIPMPKDGKSILIAVAEYLMKIKLTSPIMLRMNGKMNCRFNLTTSNLPYTRTQSVVIAVSAWRFKACFSILIFGSLRWEFQEVTE